MSSATSVTQVFGVAGVAGFSPPGDSIRYGRSAGRNYSNPVIGIIGVVPEHRGNGYAFDLLVEAPRTPAWPRIHVLLAELHGAGSWTGQEQSSTPRTCGPRDAAQKRSEPG